MNTVLAWVVEGTAVAVIATLALQLMPRSSASARHLFCWLTLLIVAAWPLGGIVLVPIEPQRVETSRSVAAGTNADLHVGGAAAADSGVAPAAPVRAAALMLPPIPDALSRAITTLWLSVVSVALLRLLVAVYRLRQLTRTATPFPPALVKAMRHWRATRRRPARLLASDRIDGACAVGFWRPSILVSSRLVATLDLTGLESLVLHEQAHLRRGDDWLRLLQQIVLAVAGVHPAVWWLSRQIDQEREVACDRDVVARTGAPLPYARALARIAAAAQGSSRHAAVLAPAALLDRAGLARRVERLLEPRAVSRLRLSAGSGAAATALVAAVASLSYLPPFVLFAAPQVALAVVGTPLSGTADQSAPIVAETTPLVAPQAERAAVALLQTTPATTTPNDPIATIGVSAHIGERANVDVNPVSGAVAGPVDSANAHDRIAVTPQELATAAAPVTEAPVATVLDATPLPFASGSRSRVDTDAQDTDWIAQPFIETGKGVARASVATSDAVSRAGQSIGRFFKGQSLTVARQF